MFHGGGQVNAAHFHTNMLKQWEKNDGVYDEYYYKQLIGKKILYEHIGNIISEQIWYQEKRAYRPQLIAYTFSKLVYEAKKIGLKIDYQKIWDFQRAPECLDSDIKGIARQAFDTLYDNNRTIANIETYSKKEDCWKNLQKRAYNLSSEAKGGLISDSDIQIEKTRMKQSDQFSGEINELYVFRKGTGYWNSLMNQPALKDNEKALAALKEAVNYCNMLQTSMSESALDILRELVG